MTLKQDSNFSAAAHVLGHTALCRTTAGTIDEQNERIAFDTIFGRYESMSSGEKALVDAALSLWNGGHPDRPSLGTVLAALDSEGIELVLEACVALRRPKGFRPAIEIAEQAIGLFIEEVNRKRPWTGLGDLQRSHAGELSGMKAVALREVREGMAVRDEELS